MASSVKRTSALEAALIEDQRRVLEQQAADLLGVLVQEDQYVGEVYSISYESALVQIHDYHRKLVGGIPSLCFLLATRIKPGESINYQEEDASVILLRVLDSAPLPNNQEAERIRVETAQRASGDPEIVHWDSPKYMDPATHNHFGFAGVKCQVVGTFFLDQLPGSEENTQLALRFGSDLSNYYPNRGLKVYKPKGDVLFRIVNYRDPLRNDDEWKTEPVPVGEVRYASTNRSFQEISNVKVVLSPEDLFDQKTALFGMTRTGKSNSTKIIIKSVFELRFLKEHLRIGQVVFDQDGEYANDNEQDQGSGKNPSAIKNVWSINPQGQRDDVVTYGILPHPLDPNRKYMRLNFFEESNLQIGKEIINAVLAARESLYIQNFRQVAFEKPDDSFKTPEYFSAKKRYDKRVLVYRTLLVKAGFTPPANIKPSTERLFNEDLLRAMENSEAADKTSYKAAAQILSKDGVTWDQLAKAFEILQKFINTKGSGYQQFDDAYMADPKHGGESWADLHLKNLLDMFAYENGAKQVGAASKQHTHKTMADYAEDIYKELCEGKLVIIDQSSGEQELNKASADRIMWHIFRANRELFRQGEKPKRILVYVEEAHNLLPAGADLNKDNQDVWVRTAKEGSKYRIGLVYATQEVSSIHHNILKNTANWFIGHLNNTDETKELCKYYDFSYFEASIRRAQDKGFLRVKTLSNPFVIPVQIERFEV